MMYMYYIYKTFYMSYKYIYIYIYIYNIIYICHNNGVIAIPYGAAAEAAEPGRGLNMPDACSEYTYLYIYIHIIYSIYASYSTLLSMLHS